MTIDTRLEALEAAGLLHQRPEEVTAVLVCSGDRFFQAADKAQVR